MKKYYLSSLVLVATISACSLFKGDYRPEVTKDLVITPADGEVDTNFVSFGQGWSEATSNDFWFTSQGAQVLPYTWFTWLEQPDNGELFRNTEHMSMLGYLPMPASESNPSGLPVGFAKTQSKLMKDAYVGFTCAACHTNMIEHDGKKFLIDGAPTLGNFVGFFDRLVDALANTHSDSEKFSRFATRVLGEEHSAGAARRLRKELLEVAEGTRLRQEVNALPDDYPHDFTSYARLDAFTNIMNAGSAFALDMLDNKNYPIAPVSYPFLWGTHQSDVVQWNGGAPNKPRSVGPMVRNAGEVVGVFGGLSIRKKPGHKNKFVYRSTVDFAGLGRLEGFVKDLESPQWDDPNSNLPAVDMERVKRGELLYAKNCAECHKVVEKKDQSKNYTSTLTDLSEVGTDPIASWAGKNHMARSGILEGSKSKIVAGERMAAEVNALSIPVNGVAGLVLASPFKVLEGVIITSKAKEEEFEEDMTDHLELRDSIRIAHNQQSGHQRWSEVQNTPTDLDLDGLKYKARPLNGIWATAPYLHNGSVPNLWELLKAPKDRVTKFWVGSQRFDPVHVGFVTSSGKNEFKVYREVDGKKTMMLGNSNLGHDYAGGQYTEEQKWDLIEYMKTL